MHGENGRPERVTERTSGGATAALLVPERLQIFILRNSAQRQKPCCSEMFNLTVAGAHTFYIRDSGWLVHNCGPKIDPNKFTKYVLDPSNSKGKHVIYEGLGYDAGDTDTLVRLYQGQAAAKFKARDFTMGKADQYGQRMTVEITIPGKGAAEGTSKTVLTGWIRDADGTIRMTNPFTGFPK